LRIKKNSIMKKNRYILKLAGSFAVLVAMIACEPQMDVKPDIGLAPTTDQLDFTIVKGATDFKFVMTNTSGVTGIPSWDLGNGSKSTDAQAIGNYPLPGTYNVKMTLVTRGGTATITKQVVQTKTDYSVFTDPKFIFLSGGVSVTAGKTWVLDSMVVCCSAGKAGGKSTV
jgi:PKD repeat protein